MYEEVGLGMRAARLVLGGIFELRDFYIVGVHDLEIIFLLGGEGRGVR